MERVIQCFKAALMVAAFAIIPRAQADPIPPGTTTADDLIINFDLSSANPAPPYDLMSIEIVVEGFAIFTFDVFGELNGAGIPLASSSIVWINGGLLTFQYQDTAPALVDGMFSVGVRVAPGAGPSELIQASAIGSINAVPEPATLALLAIGLAGLSFARRRTLS